MSDEVEFVPGMIFKLPHENAPDFVKGKLSIKREEMLEWLSKQEDEWLNAELNVSLAGKPYARVDRWKPEKQETKPDFDEDVPPF